MSSDFLWSPEEPRRQMFRNRFMGCLMALAACVGSAGVVESRSTFTARFSHEAVAGPGIQQTAILYLHYFPGDGEAIVRTQIGYPVASVSLESVHSSLGVVRQTSPTLVVDYQDWPVSTDRSDTLQVNLSAIKVGEIDWRGSIFSSLDSEGSAAHVAGFALVVGPPLDLKIEPDFLRLYPGKTTEVEVRLWNNDSQMRSVDRIDWSWPPGIQVAGEASRQLTLEPGQGDTTLWQVAVDPGIWGSLPVSGKASSAEMIGSPVSGIEFQVARLPAANVDLGEHPFLEVGERGTVRVSWHNADADDIAVAELELEVPESFDDIAVRWPEEARANDSEEQPQLRVQENRVTISQVGEIAVDQVVTVLVAGVPRSVGRHSWKSSIVPAGEFFQIPLAVIGSAPVVRPVGETASPARAYARATDLELLGDALTRSVESELNALALPVGCRIRLRPAAKREQNWLVEDALTRALMKRAYTVYLNEAASDHEALVMQYRVADSRVVYSPGEKGWNPFTSSDYRREAFGDLFLSLESSGLAVWATRVLAYATDQVPAGSMELLGGSDLLDRMTVKSDNKMLERTLSASIVGGLLYIFFVP